VKSRFSLVEFGHRGTPTERVGVDDNL
jgi:hypothetical protein